MLELDVFFVQAVADVLPPAQPPRNTGAAHALASLSELASSWESGGLEEIETAYGAGLQVRPEMYTIRLWLAGQGE